MSTYTIGEVAERSGFTASALRYYEGIGLVGPAGRTDAGHRLYDDRALGRLAFIAGPSSWAAPWRRSPTSSRSGTASSARPCSAASMSW